MLMQGYASFFGNMDSQGDTVVIGAFDRFVKTKKTVPLLWCHQWENPIGAITDLLPDNKGLFVKFVIFDTNKIELISHLTKHKVTIGLSMGYTVYKASRPKAFKELRQLEEVTLMEVSLTLNPANPKCIASFY